MQNIRERKGFIKIVERRTLVKIYKFGRFDRNLFWVYIISSDQSVQALVKIALKMLMLFIANQTND